MKKNGVHGPRQQRLVAASGKEMPFGGASKKSKRIKSAWTKLVKTRPNTK
jgi:hypothetical protein